MTITADLSARIFATLNSFLPNKEDPLYFEPITCVDEEEQSYRITKINFPACHVEKVGDYWVKMVHGDPIAVYEAKSPLAQKD
jgi:hypothetical protein